MEREETENEDVTEEMEKEDDEEKEKPVEDSNSPTEKNFEDDPTNKVRSHRLMQLIIFDFLLTVFSKIYSGYCRKS